MKLRSIVKNIYYNCFTALDFVWDKLGEPVPEETFTHSQPSWSSIILYLLPPSTVIHGILYVQFTCLTVFLLTLCPCLLWSNKANTLHIHGLTEQYVLVRQFQCYLYAVWCLKYTSTFDVHTPYQVHLCKLLKYLSYVDIFYRWALTFILQNP